jgi:rubrerythrin
MNALLNSDAPKRLTEPDPALAARLNLRAAELEAGATTSARTAAGLAMGAAPVTLAAVASDAFGQDDLPGIVADVLNFALTLEYLEAEFYATGVGTANLLPAESRDMFDQIRKHEAAHVAFLQGVLGSRAVGKPTFDFTAGGQFGDVFSNAQTFAALAQAFEDTGVRAYKGQAANLMGHKPVLRSALRIHSVEARHAAQVRRYRQQKGWIAGNDRGNLPAATQPVYNGEGNRFQFILAQPGRGVSWTEAFDETLTKGQVLEIVKPFIRGAR